MTNEQKRKSKKMQYQQYRATGRMEINKKKKIARDQARKEHYQRKRRRRIEAGLPVHNPTEKERAEIMINNKSWQVQNNE